MTPFVFSQPQFVWTLCVFTACSFLFLLSAFWLCRKQPARLLDSLCLCQQTACDEEGVRLAFGKSSSANLDPSEEEIDRYFKHKQSHNIEHARHLGSLLEEDILSFRPELEYSYLTSWELNHVRMLYLFVTEDCVRHFIKDSILLNLVLAQINDILSLRLPDFYNYGNFSQYRSYTVYKMCLDENRHSFPEEKAVQIGRCWAKMIGKPDDEHLSLIGSKFYLMMKSRCEQRLLNTSFTCI